MWYEIVGAIFELSWVYRGWAWLFSSKYRAKVKEEWRNSSPFFIGIDILISLLFMAAEIYLVYLVYQNNS
jgi:hypothetical protein